MVLEDEMVFDDPNGDDELSYIPQLKGKSEGEQLNEPNTGRTGYQRKLITKLIKNKKDYKFKRIGNKKLAIASNI